MSIWLNSVLVCSVLEWRCSQLQHCCQIQHFVNNQKFVRNDNFLLFTKFCNWQQRHPKTLQFKAELIQIDILNHKPAYHPDMNILVVRSLFSENKDVTIWTILSVSSILIIWKTKKHKWFQCSIPINCFLQDSTIRNNDTAISLICNILKIYRDFITHTQY